ncbi:BHLH domain-containing protein [Lachancea thermotolerans]
MTNSTAPSDTGADPADQRKRKRASRESSLSEDQKRQNHVSSEQRRRQAMRQTYDTLVDIVPDLTSAQSRSELQIYAKSYNYLSHALTSLATKSLILYDG